MDGETPHSVAGREALQCAAWEQARDIFERLLSEAESAAAHEGLSWALWWLNDGDAVLAARETAYRLYRDAGDTHGAARMAVWLASDVLDFRGEPAISGAWIERAHRLLDGRKLSPEHGWLDLHEGTIALDLEGDSTTARRLGDRCAGTGCDLGVIDLEMLGMALSGQAAVHEGDVRQGMRLLDQAVLAATTGELVELVAVGWSCCSLIKACEQIRDHERAAQWAQQTLAFARRVRFDPWFGICRSFYASVLTCRGAWDEAEAELVAAAELMASTRPPWAGEAMVRLGELRVRQGRLLEAERLFAPGWPPPQSAGRRGGDRLLRGDAQAALRHGERALRNLRDTERTGRVPVLERTLRGMQRGRRVPELRDRADHLTSRERQILRLVADGLSDREMANRLDLREHTVHRHVSNILTKLGVPSRSAAVARAVRNELL